MTIEVGGAAAGGAISSLPAFPSPIIGPDGELGIDGPVLPFDGTLVNQIKVPTGYSTAATGDYVAYLSGVTVWTINATDINAACDGFLGIVSQIYDSVNDRLYVFAVDAGTSPYTCYTAYITMETGAITNVGNFQFAVNPGSYQTIAGAAPTRLAIDSGNFTLKFTDRTVEIDSITGLSVLDVASINRTGANFPGTYTTLDGTVGVSLLLYFGTPDGYFVITRNGISARVAHAYQYNFASSAASAGVYASNWGDKVKLHTPSGVQVSVIRNFLRTDFDDWLIALADYAGI